jgi:hypothetical protein
MKQKKPPCWKASSRATNADFAAVLWPLLEGSDYYSGQIATWFSDFTVAAQRGNYALLTQIAYFLASYATCSVLIIRLARYSRQMYFAPRFKTIYLH